MRKAEFKGYVYYITEDGKHIYDSKGKERKIQVNRNRGNRQHLGLNGKDCFVNILVANAFPEICGVLTEGSHVHHIDGDPTNNEATNLLVITERDHYIEHYGIIVKYTLDGQRVGEYETSYKAAESVDNKVSSAAIRECLCGNTKQSGGYIWKREFKTTPYA